MMDGKKKIPSNVTYLPILLLDAPIHPVGESKK
jgi:hypothetical protein